LYNDYYDKVDDDVTKKTTKAKETENMIAVLLFLSRCADKFFKIRVLNG